MKIHLGTDYKQVEELGLYLEAQKPTILGLDTETTIGKRNVSLLQLATEKECYLLQLGRVFEDANSLPPVIGRILGNPEIVKVGVGLDHDAELLDDSYGFKLRSSLDLQAIARTLSEPCLSLNDLCTKYLPTYPGKDPLGHRGNWDINLTNLQQHYAANDAYYSLLLYQVMVLHQAPVKKETCHESDDFDMFKLWAQEYISNSKYPLAFDSLVNYTINSYAPWRKKYLTSERKERATQALTKLSKILPFDGAKRKFLVN